MLGVPELAATKAYTIGRGRSFRDYVDMYTVVSGNFVSLNKVVDMAKEKYHGAFNGRLFLEQLIYLDDIQDTQIIFLEKPVTKKQIERFFVREMRKLKL